MEKPLRRRLKDDDRCVRASLTGTRATCGPWAACSMRCHSAAVEVSSALMRCRFRHAFECRGRCRLTQSTGLRASWAWSIALCPHLGDTSILGRCPSTTSQSLTCTASSWQRRGLPPAGFLSHLKRFAGLCRELKQFWVLKKGQESFFQGELRLTE